MVKKMTRRRLLIVLKECSENSDVETAHVIADDALLEYIGDEKVTKAFESWDKWYG